ncbi:uncharacterized protein PAC_04050 [Phialocephala subalpina]|uniref:Uncharacterized protein n=1 Tax=Phialocephala subalpina TaxID=576137 RepID=A0A1L7WN15_9HELO|nr:uncharacterized protein PAC_04050 [Phialocephala subalpina]
MNLEALHSHAQHFIPDTFGPKTHPGFIIQSLNEYMNAHPEHAIIPNFKSLAIHYRKTDGVIRPAFFNPENDVLYLKREKSVHANQVPRFHKGLWKLGDATTGEIRKLAIELDYMSVSDAMSRRRSWKNIGDCKALEDPKSQPRVLYLVCLSDREVLKITLGHSGELDSQEWSFRLMKEHEQDRDLFTKEMGHAWSGVIWNVKLGKSNGHMLWTVAKGYWKPYFS